VSAEGRERNEELENREQGDEVGLRPGAYQDARGVDRSLIRYCLRLTPTQRMAENDGALAVGASVRETAKFGQAGAAAAPDLVVAVSRAHGTR
jgi:hypothetical protein